MTAKAYSAAFGSDKGGLATVAWRAFDSNLDPLTAWSTTGVTELVSGDPTGSYVLYSDLGALAKFIAWRTGDGADERYVASALATDSFIFFFSPYHTGKSVGYTFYDSSGVAIGSEITDVTELIAGTGIYAALAATIPAGATWVMPRTIEANPVNGSPISLDTTGGISASDFLSELRAWLIIQSPSLPLYLDKLPSSPVEAAGIYTNGGDPDRFSGLENFRFRVISRGETRSTAYGRAKTIYDLLRSDPIGGAREIDLTSFHVYVLLTSMINGLAIAFFTRSKSSFL